MTATPRHRRSTGAAVLLTALALPSAARAADPVRVVSFPSPDARSASARTEVSFRGATAGALRGLRVTASRSGTHGGALKAHADGGGVSFVPTTAFAPGERVRARVPAGVRVRGGDGRISEFTTARVVEGFATEGPSGAPSGRGRFRTLRSRPDLAPPTITSRVAAAGRQPGYVMLAPKQGTGQGGPMIVDDAGKALWFLRMPDGIRATDFKAQTYRGAPVLTWWQGQARGGSGRGEGVVVDSTYKTVRRVRAGNGISADLHEFTLTGRDTALLVSYVPVRRNLGAVGGPADGVAVDSVAQEVELSTGRVRFEWHSLDDVPLSDSDLPRPTSSVAPFDYFHINSLDLDPAGGYIVSGRHVSTVLKLDDAGGVRWRLGGKSGTLKRGPGVSFTLQHDARARGDGTYTIFDNSAAGVRKKSRVIAVRVDEVRRTATLIGARSHPDTVLAATQGNGQLLPNGGLFVGWGSQGRASEFTPAGKLVLDLKLPLGYDTYRAYRSGWTGVPYTTPRAAARPVAGGGRTAVDASWNGSTQTASWTVLAGPSASELAPVVTAPRSGLETEVVAQTTARYVAVQANDAAGAALKRSPAVRVTGR